MEGFDLDTWSYFEAVGLVKKDLGHKGKFKFWWQVGSSLEKGLKELCDDEDAMEMSKIVKNNAIVDVSVVNVEGGRQEGDVIIGNVSAGDEDENDSSDESLNNVHFDDSEEERDLGSDDGFNLPEVGVAEAALNEELQKMKELTGLTKDDEICGPHVKRKKRRNQPIFDESGPSQSVDESGPTQNVDEEGARATNATANDVPATTEVPHSTKVEFVPENISNMHQIDDDYSTEELESDCYDSALEDNDRPHYPNEATTNVQATNDESVASTPPATNNGATTNEDPTASTVALVAVENQPRPREGQEHELPLHHPPKMQLFQLHPSLELYPRLELQPSLQLQPNLELQPVVPKTIASKSGAVTKTAFASKTATESSKNATASTSNKVTSASKGKNVSKKSGHRNYQNQPFIPPFAQEKTVASCLAHLVRMNNIWAHKLMMKEGRKEPDLDLKDQRVEMKQIWMYQILMEIKFDGSGVQHMGRIVGSFV
ncbi:hypothetical protein SESBI_14217 [Sesbania bispinosa]|nr:hypothetical protein SESBI_14217 [Sesbania bispinosa]